MPTKSRSHSRSDDDNTSDNTADQIKSLLADAEKTLANVADRPAEEIAALRERMRDALDEGRASARRAVDYARAQANRADDAVHTHPYAAIGIAAGVALVAGILVGRGCRSR